MADKNTSAWALPNFYPEYYIMMIMIQTRKTSHITVSIVQLSQSNILINLNELISYLFLPIKL